MYLGPLPAVSNKATYRQSFQVNDGITDALVDLAGAAIVFEIRDRDTRTTRLSATSGNGVALVGTGVFEVTFAADAMRALADREYEVGCTIATGGETAQFIIGTLPVLDGIVR